MAKTKIELSKWNNDFSVGVDIIDNDHKKLFSILRQLKTSVHVSEKPADAVIQKLLSDLHDYTVIHFEREEALMKACGYPYYENHVHVHNMIRGQVEQYINSYHDSKASLNIELLTRFMETWLIDHIGSLDKQYSAWMDGKESLLEKTNALFEENHKIEITPKISDKTFNVLVIDDEKDICDAICTHIKKSKIGTSETRYITEGLKFANVYNKNFNLIILDLFLPDLDGVEIIRQLAKKHSQAALILMSGKDPNVLHSAKILAESRELNILGILEKPFKREDIHSLLKLALEQQKNRAPDAESDNLMTQQEIQKALDKEEIVPYFQPKVQIDTGKPVGFEALARWIHPQKGLISPADFIPLCEKYGLIDELTVLIMDKTFAQLSLWTKAGLQLKASINVSALTLKNLDTPENLLTKIEKYDLDPSIITLEVTESAMSEELSNSLDILTRIRMKGFMLSIDDFGTGFSSMLQLSRAPFNELKVDQSFIRDMDVDSGNRAICESTIELARKLNMSVCAEGIETKQVVDILRKLKCAEGQGYYFGKPMAADEFEIWYKEKVPPENETETQVG